MRDELALKRWFRRKYDGWSEAYEPRHGSGTGMPDLQILMEGVLLPVELKVGRLTRNKERLFIFGFEPSQISWHIRFWQSGGKAIILVGFPGIEQTQWELWELPPVSFELMDWKKGWLWTSITRWENWNSTF